MKKLLILLALTSLSLSVAWAQHSSPNAIAPDLEKLGNILRSNNLIVLFRTPLNDMFVVEDPSTNKQGIMNLQGRILLPVRYDRVEFMDNPQMILVKEDEEKCGLLDSQMKWVMKPGKRQFRFGSFPMIVWSEKDKYGLIDSLGHWLIPMRYSDISNVNETQGWAIIDHSYLYDYIHKKVVMNDVSAVYNGHDGIWSATKASTGQDGLIDSQFRWVVEPKYKYITWLANGIYEAHDSLVGLIDIHGNEITELKYGHLLRPHHGLTMAEREGRKGFIDTKGRELIHPQYDYASSFNPDGLAVVGLHSAYYIIDTLGNIIDSTTLQLAAYPYDSTILWKEQVAGTQHKHYVLTNYQLEEICTYDKVRLITSEEPYRGLYPVRQGGRWGLADHKLRPIIPCKYLYTKGDYASTNSIVTLQDSTTRYIDKQGNTLLHFDALTDVLPLSSEYYIVFIGVNGEYSGIVDIWGHSTFSEEELAKAKKHYLLMLPQY